MGTVVSGFVIFGVLGYIAFAMLTSDALWLFRKTLWIERRLWINPFGKHSIEPLSLDSLDEAPPLFWNKSKK